MRLSLQLPSHPPLIVSGGEARSQKRFGGFRRNRTFKQMIMNDWVWVVRCQRASAAYGTLPPFPRAWLNGRSGQQRTLGICSRKTSERQSLADLYRSGFDGVNRKAGIGDWASITASTLLNVALTSLGAYSDVHVKLCDHKVDTFGWGVEGHTPAYSRSPRIS